MSALDGERAKAVARPSRPALGDLRRPMGHRIAERSHLEPIRQRTERRGMASFPGLTKTDDANAKFHNYNSSVQPGFVPAYGKYRTSRFN